MKKKLLFIGLFMCSLSLSSYGQSQTNTQKESTPIVVSSNEVLSAQRAKLDSKQAEINQSTTTSRAQVSKLNDEFRALKEEYLRLLKVELEKTTDAQLKGQLQEEIERYSDIANSQTR
jgi:hypothetical protein